MKGLRAWLSAVSAELRRRHVFRVAGVYAVVAWIVTQVANVAFPALQLPPWTVTFVVIVALLGFPVAVVLAWAFEITPEGVRRTPAIERPSALSRSIGSPVLRRPALWVIAFLGIGVWTTWMMWSSEAVPEAGAPATVAVLPFSVHGSERVAYLREGIVNLVSTQLDGAGELRSVDPHALLSGVSWADSALGPERAAQIARRFGARLYVLGDVLEAGDRIRISASLYEMNGAPRAVTQATVEGKEGALFELVDRLVRELLAARSDGPGGELSRLAAITTDSLSALKAYLAGEVEFRAGRFRVAADSFRRAVELDPSFALAWYRLSLAAEWAGERSWARQAVDRSLRHGDRLPEPTRRLMEAFRAYVSGRAGEAERRYRGIVAEHGDDVEAWYQLGEVLFHSNPLLGRPIGEAREPFERVRAFEPDRVGALVHLATLAAIAGRTAQLDSLVRLAVDRNADPAWLLPLRALRAFVSGGAGDRDAVLAELDSADAAVIAASLWLVGYTGDVKASHRLARLLAAARHPSKVRALGHVVLAHLEAAQGRRTAAFGELEAATALHRPIGLEHRALLAAAPVLHPPREEIRAARTALAAWTPSADSGSASTPSPFLSWHEGLHEPLRVYLLGRLDVRLGDLRAALREADRLEAIGAPLEVRALARDLARRLRAEVAWARGSAERALALLEEGDPTTFHEMTPSSPFFTRSEARYLHARLLEETGRLPEGLRWYHTFPALSVYDLAYLAPAHLRRAQIFEQLDRPERAADHYGRFIELWQAADPELQPLVEDARARAARLARAPGSVTRPEPTASR